MPTPLGMDGIPERFPRPEPAATRDRATSGSIPPRTIASNIPSQSASASVDTRDLDQAAQGVGESHLVGRPAADPDELR